MQSETGLRYFERKRIGCCGQRNSAHEGNKMKQVRIDPATIQMNQRWKLNGLIYRIREVHDHVLLVEIFPTRAIYPIALCDFCESGAVLMDDCCVKNTP